MSESIWKAWLGRIKGAWAVLSGEAFATYYVTVEQQNIFYGFNDTSVQEMK